MGSSRTRIRGLPSLCTPKGAGGLSNVPGFGTERPGLGPRGLRADQPPPNQSDDLHAIRVRYVGPKTLQVQPFSFAANQGQRFDMTGTPVNAIILTTMTGQVNGYFGDNTSQFGKAGL